MNPSPATNAPKIDLNAVEPVLVTAPSARNGITLVQRMLNSSGQFICYGENTVLVQHYPRLAMSGIHSLKNYQAGIEQSRARFAAGETEYWSSDLSPSAQDLAVAVVTAFADLVNVFDIDARNLSQKKWGIKNPMTDPDMHTRLFDLVPKLKVIAIYRNPIDVLKSAKARNFVENEQDLRNYVINWRENVQALANTCDDPRVMLFPHAALTQGGESAQKVIQHIEKHIGITSIDPKVLDRRINTFDSSGQSGGSYVQPQSLTEIEKDIVAAETAGLMDQIDQHVYKQLGLSRAEEIAA